MTTETKTYTVKVTMELPGNNSDTFTIQKATGVLEADRFLVISNTDGDEFRYAMNRVLRYYVMK